MRPKFHIATPEEIKAGKTTDVYFLRTKEVLQRKDINRRVVAEVTASALPNHYPWGVLSGVEEVAALMDGYRVDIDCMPEGSAFYPVEPVMRVEGNYREFCEFETPILGLLCQASGITTKAARLRKLAGEKSILSFGIRRMHPAIAPMIDRAAYIGGVEGFSGVAAEKLIGREAVGTMPHALIITVGDQVRAWQYFDEVVDRKVPRVALVDTYYDEKIEAVMAAEAVKGLQGVRLDTPGSRRGKMRRIAEEVRWELDIRGFKNVKIIVSGGVDEEAIKELDNVDGFGIGTSISSAKTVDFAMDIIEMEGKPCAKRGKLGGKKEVYRCTKCHKHKVVPTKEAGPKTCSCGGPMESLLKPLIRDGKLVRDLPSADEIKGEVLGQLGKLEM
ncbi:MAG: nicotinate phosphoribosyltransferase [Euryarchaeota archaeon]|nr:nicotinate phosphoribosyltransferase [Euryarchaeota archaeon]